jgi:hypothetical protein
VNSLENKENGTHAHGMRTANALPSLAKPSLAMPSQAKPLSHLYPLTISHRLRKSPNPKTVRVRF